MQPDRPTSTFSDEDDQNHNPTPGNDIQDILSGMLIALLSDIHH